MRRNQIARPCPGRLGRRGVRDDETRSPTACVKPRRSPRTRSCGWSSCEKVKLYNAYTRGAFCWSQLNWIRWRIETVSCALHFHTTIWFRVREKFRLVIRETSAWYFGVLFEKVNYEYVRYFRSLGQTQFLHRHVSVYPSSLNIDIKQALKNHLVLCGFKTTGFTQWTHSVYN